MRALCERVGERDWVLLDEALADFLSRRRGRRSLAAARANLLVFRSFSKAHAMAGFRVGYVLAPTADGPSASRRRSASTRSRAAAAVGGRARRRA